MKQAKERIEILDIPVDALDMQEAVARVASFLEEKGRLHLVATANAEMIMQAQEDAHLGDILRTADLVVADGAGVVWAASHQGTPLRERVAGFDLTQQLLATGAARGYSFFFLGAAPGVAQAAVDQARLHHPQLRIVGCRDGFFQAAEEEELLRQINASGADILLVALGVPRQEKWLHRLASRLQVPVAMGVGGTFDVMAGKMTRAPLWMQKAGLEWLYRLLRQPSRLVRMLALPRFVLRVWLRKNS